ncbi:MAG: hypothetical protein WD801_05610 [Gemmatimonadaceae bacterium]
MKSFGRVVLLSAALFAAACAGDPPAAPTTEVPAAPTNVAAVCGNQKITLSWSAVTGAVSYNVNRATASGGTSTVAGSSTGLTYVDVSGTVGTQYFYTITAVNAEGTSVASSEVSETVCRLMGGALQAKVLAFTSANANVSTFAGSTSGFGGMVDGTGTSARFSQPQGMTTDGTFLYVADYVNNAIRKIDPATGAVTVFAGSSTGAAGSTDGTGTAARFLRPYDITSDGTNLFVTDYNNCTIRRIVISSAVVTTLAGEVGTCATPVDGSGSAARFASPQGITTDGTNLYVTENTAVRKVVIATGAVTTFAGSTDVTVGHTDGVGTAARFNNLEGITTDGTNLYVVDQYYGDVRRIVIASATVSTFAGDYTAVIAGSTDGTGTAAKFNKPFGITTDGTNLFIVEQYGDVVRKVVISSAVATTLAGTPNTASPGNPGLAGTTDGIGAAARFNSPQGITIHCGSLYIGDSGNSSIRRIR